jgi:hypothetical protein
MRRTQLAYRPIDDLHEHGRLRPAGRLRIVGSQCRRPIEESLKASGLPLRRRRRVIRGIRPRRAPRGGGKMGERLQLRADHCAVASSWSAAAIA